MANKHTVLLENIGKRFGDVIANDGINLEIRGGEILSLLGENGSGKTTLMNMLSGIYFPDEGQIYVDGSPVTIRSPKDSFDLGIGMIHQHFKLIDVLTVAENTLLGLKEQGRLNTKACEEKIRDICSKYRFDVDPTKHIYELTVSQKQTVEIVKVLYRGANILILDEPTAVLTPQETKRLFSVLRNMRDDGKAIVIITHKLNEVMELSDRVSVLRKGKYIGTVNTSETSPKALTDMMVGRATALNIERDEPVDIKERLLISNLNCKSEDGLSVLSNVSFTAYGGEILGIAGISGSGQKELLECIAGLFPAEEGSSIMYIDPKSGEKKELLRQTPAKIRALGVKLAFVPEDRLGMGLVGGMCIRDNIMLKTYKRGKTPFTDRITPKKAADRIIEELEVVTPGEKAPVRRMSGGNVQKILVGREIDSNPTVLMSAYAVRGLDINTSYTIYRLMGEQKKKGVAVVYVGEDLDVLIELCDRIVVLCAGRVSGIVDARTTSKEEIGLLMTQHSEEEETA